MNTRLFPSTRTLAIVTLLVTGLDAAAQSGLTFSGSIQSDILLPQTDKTIRAQADEDVQTNTYVDLGLSSRYVDAGVRFEYLDHPLPGFESDFKGWGLPYFYGKVHLDKAELTLGDFYEQFGSGFVLRTYEERSLGIDNSLRGARLVLKPWQALTVKALAGRQRNYWRHNKAWITGADAELSIDQLLKPLSQNGHRLVLGASFVNKHEKDEDILIDATHRLNLPKDVTAMDLRLSWQKDAFSLLGEYAWKSQDPSFDNGYIYRNGQVAMLSASYSKKGFSALVMAKRSDNFSFRSRRSQNGTSSFINHLPAFTQDQTYALAALYPYATRPQGEWAYQAELGYNFKRRTPLGGRYGMNVKMNFSHVRGIDVQTLGGRGSDGYRSSFFKQGDETYYQDFDIQVERKLSKAFKLNLMYMNQRYNKTIVEGEGGMIRSNIFIADGKYQFSPKTTLRAELQYLTTPDDEGDWAFALAELSLVPHWMITLSDQWNYGKTDVHYYLGAVTYAIGAHRIQLGYGRTRAGYNCSGGVCRYVPASKGFTLSYNYNF